MTVTCLPIRIALEDGSGYLLLEDGSGYLILEDGLVPMNGDGDTANARKLEHKLETCNLAVLLTNNGFMNPATIRAATDEQLQAVGVTDSQLALLREVY